PGFGRQRPEVAEPGGLHRALHAAGPTVVRRQGEMPVAVEHVAQRVEVLRGGDRRLLGIGALVDVPVAVQTVLEPGARHELPDALGLRVRQRVGLKALSTSGTYARSRGSPSARKTF